MKLTRNHFQKRVNIMRHISKELPPVISKMNMKWQMKIISIPLIVEKSYRRSHLRVHSRMRNTFVMEIIHLEVQLWSHKTKTRCLLRNPKKINLERGKWKRASIGNNPSIYVSHEEHMSGLVEMYFAWNVLYRRAWCPTRKERYMMYVNTFLRPSQFQYPKKPMNGELATKI